jgi:hypothetical protein
MKLPPFGTEQPTTLEECHTMIRRLQDENAALRRSGHSFGSLAERLNMQLQAERRRDRERAMVHGESESPAGVPWTAESEN